MISKPKVTFVFFLAFIPYFDWIFSRDLSLLTLVRLSLDLNTFTLVRLSLDLNPFTLVKLPLDFNPPLRLSLDISGLLVGGLSLRTSAFKASNLFLLFSFSSAAYS